MKLSYTIRPWVDEKVWNEEQICGDSVFEGAKSNHLNDGAQQLKKTVLDHPPDSFAVHLDH